MAADQRWSLVLKFAGVADGGPGSLGDVPYTCHIEARGPNEQVRERLIVTATAFHVMLRDATPSILVEVAKIPPGGGEVEIKRPGAG